MLELDREAAHVGVEQPQRLVEQLLAGLVPLEHDNPGPVGHRPESIRGGAGQRWSRRACRSARGAATRSSTTDGFRLAEHAGDRGAVFCRLEHVVPWAMQGAHWEAGEPLGARRHRQHQDLRPLRRRARRGTPAARAPPRRAPHPDGFCSVGPPAGVGEGRGQVAVEAASAPLYCRSFWPRGDCYPSRASTGRTDHGQIRNRRRLSALRHGRAGGQQERRAADPRGLAADRGGAGGRQRPAHPRRGVDAGAARGPRRERHVARRPRGRAARRRSLTSTEVDAELAGRIRASFLLAGPLLARTGEARMPAAGRRLHRPPPPRPAPRRAARARARRCTSTAAYEMWAPQGLRGCDFFMDEASVMATENTLMAAALDAGHDHDPQRRLRAARAGPRAPAGQRWARASTASARTSSTVHGRRRLGGAHVDDRAGPHRGRQLHGARRRDRRRDAHQGHRARTTSR